MRPWLFSSVRCRLIGRVLEVARLLLGEEQLHVGAQRALVALQRQHVVRLLLDDRRGDLLLAAHGVDGDDRPLQREQLQQLGDGGDLVGFLRHLGLAEHQALPARPGRDHVDRRLGPALLIGAPQRLAVDGDDVGAELGERADPGDEAALELLGIERREQVAQLVVRRRAVLERPEAAQKLKLLLAELGDLHPALGGGQHGHQAQQQHLVERIPHLAGLARVFEGLEMLQPPNDLIECALGLRLGLHHRRVLRELRGHPQI